MTIKTDNAIIIPIPEPTMEDAKRFLTDVFNCVLHALAEASDCTYVPPDGDMPGTDDCAAALLEKYEAA